VASCGKDRQEDVPLQVKEMTHDHELSTVTSTVRMFSGNACVVVITLPSDWVFGDISKQLIIPLEVACKSQDRSRVPPSSH
jgi:hypothetical protein